MIAWLCFISREYQETYQLEFWWWKSKKYTWIVPWKIVEKRWLWKQQRSYTNITKVTCITFINPLLILQDFVTYFLKKNLLIKSGIWGRITVNDSILEHYKELMKHSKTDFFSHRTYDTMTLSMINFLRMTIIILVEDQTKMLNFLLTKK